MRKRDKRQKLGKRVFALDQGRNDLWGMPANDRTVLVVEDSSDDAALIRVAFHKAGFNHLLQTAPSTEDALRYLKGEGQYTNRQLFPVPAFVLLDHAMPCDGLEVLQWVRQQPQFSSLPVVVFTGSQDPRHETMVMQAGASAYHLKPQRFEDFVKTIRKIGETWLPG